MKINDYIEIPHWSGGFHYRLYARFDPTPVRLMTKKYFQTQLSCIGHNLATYPAAFSPAIRPELIAKPSKWPVIS